MEKNVRDARHRLLQDAPPFDGFAELTERVSPNCLVAFEQASFRGLAVSTVLGALSRWQTNYSRASRGTKRRLPILTVAICCELTNE